MRYKKVIFSSTLIALLNSGCVKPTNGVNNNNQQNNNNSQNQGQVYNEQPTEIIYEDNQQPIYSDPTTTGNVDSGAYSNTQVTTTENSITTDQNRYQQTQTPQSQNNSVYGNSDVYNQNTNGSYGNSNNSGNGVYGGTPSGGNNYGGYSGGGYSDPYSPPANSSGGYTPQIDDPYSSTSSNNRYSTNTPYGSPSPSYSSPSSSNSNIKGIKLQVAAFKDYAAAEEFKDNISLPPQYTAYIQRGSINKVIVAGIPSRAKAKELANRQFPGAFIIGGTPTYSNSSSSSSSYQPYSSNNNSSSGLNIKSGIGVQVGAFSSKEKARSVAQERAKGKYTAVVKTATVGGRTIYKAIILGFKNREEAKRAIESGEVGNGFIVGGIYP